MQASIALQATVELWTQLNLRFHENLHHWNWLNDTVCEYGMFKLDLNGQNRKTLRQLSIKRKWVERRFFVIWRKFEEITRPNGISEKKISSKTRLNPYPYPYPYLYMFLCFRKARSVTITKMAYIFIHSGISPLILGRYAISNANSRFWSRLFEVCINLVMENRL